MFSFCQNSVIHFQGTVCAKGEKLDLEATSTRLRKAMKGFGTDEKVIIDVLVSHCNYELQLIKDHYKSMYGRVGKSLSKLHTATTSYNSSKIITRQCMDGEVNHYPIFTLQLRATTHQRSLQVNVWTGR